MNCVIIGAGILGTSTALELSKQGHQVRLIDAHYPGRATQAGAGIIAPWLTKRRNKAWYQLARLGAAYYPDLISYLEANGQTNHGYQRRGYLKLSEDSAELQALYKLALERKLDAPQMGDIKLLDETETSELFPQNDSLYKSLYLSGGSQVDGRLLNESMLELFQKNGGIYEQGIAHIKNKAQSPKLFINNQVLAFDKLIITNGAWMKDFFKDLDLDLRLDFQKGEIVHLTTKEKLIPIPVVDPPVNHYLLGFPNNKLVIGATRIPTHDKETKVSTDSVFTMMDKVLTRLPLVGETFLSDIRVGFRPNTFNRLPVFGPIPQYSNIFLATGLGASGLTTGPFIGKLLAQLVEEKETDIDITPYQVSQIIKETNKKN